MQSVDPWRGTVAPEGSANGAYCGVGMSSPPDVTNSCWFTPEEVVSCKGNGTPYFSVNSRLVKYDYTSPD